MSETFERVKTLLEKVGLPFYSMTVIGEAPVYIHVVTEGRETAYKWINVLSQFSETHITETLLTNKVNKGTCLRPSQRVGYHVSGIMGA